MLTTCRQKVSLHIPDVAVQWLELIRIWEVQGSLLSLTTGSAEGGCLLGCHTV
jgi:hypothetical protein